MPQQHSTQTPRGGGDANSHVPSTATGPEFQQFMQGALDVVVFVTFFVELVMVTQADMPLVRALEIFVFAVMASSFLKLCIIHPLSQLHLPTIAPAQQPWAEQAPVQRAQQAPVGPQALGPLVGSEAHPSPLNYFEVYPLLPATQEGNNEHRSWMEAMADGRGSFDGSPGGLLSHLRLELARRMQAANYDVRSMRSWRREDLTAALDSTAFIRQELHRLRSDDPESWQRDYEEAEKASAETERILETALVAVMLADNRAMRQTEASRLRARFEREAAQRMKEAGRYIAATEWSSNRIDQLFDVGAGQ